MISRRFAAGLAATLFSLLLLAAPPAPKRIVAIADIHGDYDSFVRIAQRAGLVDSRIAWSGGTAILVQTGDYTDRGPKTRAVMDLLMTLQKDAPRRGGQAIVLLGNHEVSNIIGDLRYVVPADYAGFADNKSEQRRKDAFKAYAALRGDSVSETEWMKSHPPGFIEHREAFGPDGKYGRWLRSLPAVAQVDDTIFLHGGISPQLAASSVKQINEAVTGEIKAFDLYKKYLVDQKIALPFYTIEEMAETAGAALKATDEKDSERKKLLEGFLGFPGWLSVHPEGPLWFRGYAQWSEEEGEKHLEGLTKALKVTRFVVGHTVQPHGQVTSRFGGKVFLIDTGMLSGYFEGGRASALEILDGKVTPIYP